MGVPWHICSNVFPWYPFLAQGLTSAPLPRLKQPINATQVLSCPYFPRLLVKAAFAWSCWETWGMGGFGFLFLSCLWILNSALLRAASAALQSHGFRLVIEAWIYCWWRSLIYNDFSLKLIDKPLLRKKTFPFFSFICKKMYSVSNRELQGNFRPVLSYHLKLMFLRRCHDCDRVTHPVMVSNLLVLQSHQGNNFPISICTKAARLAFANKTNNISWYYKQPAGKWDQ